MPFTELNSINLNLTELLQALGSQSVPVVPIVECGAGAVLELFFKFTLARTLPCANHHRHLLTTFKCLLSKLTTDTRIAMMIAPTGSGRLSLHCRRPSLERHGLMKRVPSNIIPGERHVNGNKNLFIKASSMRFCA